MFTGLVAGTGTVVRAERTDDGARVRIRTALADDLRDGDSVAVNGVCLTAIDIEQGSFAAEAMNETLSHTALADLDAGVEVNLELALRAGDRLGGHIVQGHVDAVGSVRALADDGFARRVTIEAPEEVLRYVVVKGSIAVDGVSLTVADVDNQSFTVSLIPETLKRTILGKAEPGTRVNLEIDVFAKYIEKLMKVRT